MKTLFAVDQFGNAFGPLNEKSPKKSLLDIMYRKTAQPMYIDQKNGTSKHIGYVVMPTRGSGESEHWCRFETRESF